MALKENYKDDILDVSVNTKRKYRMTENADGTISLDDETVYTQEGDNFGASDLNAINSEVNEVVNNLGAKNMLPNNATTQTINGITFTVNNDGSVTVNGATSGVASLFLIGSTSAWGSNQYKNCILSGCPSGGSGDSYRIVMQTSSDGSAISKTYLEDGNGVLIDDDNQYCKIYIRIAGGYTANNLIFKPMIRPSGIKDDTYAPYAQTNKELTDNLSWYVANGWLPAIPSGDVPANMEDCSWAMLKSLASAGTLGNYYQIGDTKTIELTGGERVVMELVSVNDGEGTAGGYYPKGTADFISKDCMLTTRQMNTSNTNSGGWPSCKLRTDLNNVVYDLLPQAVKDAIVEKTHKSSAGGQSTTLVEHSDKLWLPTEWEIFGSITYAAGTENGNVNKHYAVFDSAGDRIKHLGTGGAATGWWECSPRVGNSTIFCGVNTSGGAGIGDASNPNGVPLCFRIGQLFI